MTVTGPPKLYAVITGWPCFVTFNLPNSRCFQLVSMVLNSRWEGDELEVIQPVRTLGFLARGFIVFVLGAAGIMRFTVCF
jgi:hypothetical protein